MQATYFKLRYLCGEVMMVASLSESDGKLDSGYSLKVVPAGFSEGLIVGMSKKVSWDDFKAFGLRGQKDGIAVN